MMQWKDQIPIQPAQEPPGQEMGRLHELIRLHIKLKPPLTRQFHLGIEKQSLSGFDINNLPEIKRITDAQFLA